MVVCLAWFGEMVRHGRGSGWLDKSLHLNSARGANMVGSVITYVVVKQTGELEMIIERNYRIKYTGSGLFASGWYYAHEALRVCKAMRAMGIACNIFKNI